MAFNKAKALQDAEKSLSQGKTSQAIKQYLQVFEKEPGDLALLNTVGDIYVRDKNLPEAMKHFHKLADSYTQEGFTVKAVAIYKKISKLDPSSVDVLLKMAELYMVQGLNREAREQFTQAVEFYKKKNQNDKALEVFRKIVALDPENINYRVRLAEFCESLGKKEDATRAYLDAAEIALRRGDTAAAETALKKTLKLDDKNPRLHLLQARLALAKNQPNEVERIFNSAPETKTNPAARQILLEAYLAGQKLEEAEKLVSEAFRSKPADFSSMTAYVELCIRKDEVEAAYKALADVSDIAISQGHGIPLMELLRQIWTKRPDHIPTLELIHKTVEKTADEFTLPEILDALGQAYVKAGDLEKAEKVYRQLVSREPENEQLKALLKQVLTKQGKEPSVTSPQALADSEMSLTPASEEGMVKAPSASGAGEEAAVVKETLDNCDLFSRYGLLEKAFAELDKTLVTYPNQVELYERMLDISQKSDPGRTKTAAKSLARIYTERNDLENAQRYELLASKAGASASSRGTAPPAKSAAPATPPPSVATEFDLSAEFLGAPAEIPAATSEEVPVDLLAPTNTEATTSEPAPPFDLSSGTEAPAPAVAPPAAPSGINFEESRVEVDYYLEQGFFDEARKAVQALEQKFPGDPQIVELRRRVEQRTSPPPPPVQEPPPRPKEPAPPVQEPPPPREEPPPPVEEPPPAPDEPPPSIQEPPPVPSAPGRVALEQDLGGPQVSAASSDPLGGLINDLESSLEGMGTPTPSGHAAAEPRARATPASRPSGGATSPLSGFLDEFSDGEQAEGNEDEAQTHYDLGVAFREMNLLDEAIGEFQKVVKGATKGIFPPHFLQACTLLALCFMDKKLPAIAIKWYLRALESPDLDEEATMAVQYDLGVAYEQAGDSKIALEKFSEVYSQNIDYRDVAEKIRLLQTKP